MQKRTNDVTLDIRNPYKRKNRKLINRLLRLGHTVRLNQGNDASRFDRR